MRQHRSIPIPLRASAAYTGRTTQEYSRLPETPPPKPRGRPFWRYVILVTLIGLTLFFLYNKVVYPAYVNLLNQWHYGDRRIRVFDAGDIGHGGDSVFLSFLWKGSIVVIEVVGNQAHVYNSLGEVTGDEYGMVVLSAQDMNNDGKTDIIVHVEGSSVSLVLLNTGSALRLAQ